MIYSEKEYKILLEKVKKLEKENEINKKELNKNKKVVIRKVIDIEVKTKITIYKYYPEFNMALI